MTGALATRAAGERAGAGRADLADLARRLDAVLPVLEGAADDVDARAAFPVDGLAALRRSGLLGLLVPEAHGGLGGGLSDLVEVTDRLAGACASTAMIFGMHCQQAAVVIAHSTGRLRGSLLPRLATGDVYLASVTTERGKGGHLLTASAPLHRDGDELAIDRDAPIVTGGEHADGFLITMRAPGAPANAVSLVYADRAQVRYETYGDWDPLGMRATRSVGMRLRGRVPADQVIGVHGGFREVALATMVPVGHIAWAAAWLGAARGALRAIVDLARQPAGRRQLPVRSELFTQRLARIRLDLDTVHAYLHRVVAEVDATDPADLSDPAAQLHLNGLKVLASERCFAAVDQMVQLVGLRHGYLRGGPLRLERVFRDLRSASLNYANDRLLAANGTLTLLDRHVRLC